MGFFSPASPVLQKEKELYQSYAVCYSWVIYQRELNPWSLYGTRQRCSELTGVQQNLVCVTHPEPRWLCTISWMSLWWDLYSTAFLYRNMHESFHSQAHPLTSKSLERPDFELHRVWKKRLFRFYDETEWMLVSFAPSWIWLLGGNKKHQSFWAVYTTVL